jgi:glutamate---cysteine ligase / carboxylate-amine ligase
VNHAFNTEFTVGVEEELHLVDRDTHQLSPDAVAVLSAMNAPEGHVGHEAYAAQLELRSGACPDAQAACADLAASRAAAAAAGATLMGVGLHPADTWGESEIVDEPRYREVGRAMRDVFGRTPEAALHVHVGIPDPDTAIRVFNGMRRHLPLLIGLAANSPWWFGRDSGLASARWALVRSYPGRGIPPAFADWGEYVEHLERLATAGGPPDYTLVWWDIRPHPRLGTIEVRELDAQSSLEDVEALAALIRALARREAEAPTAELPSAEAIAWSCFRAARDGLDAEVLHEGRLVALRDAAREAAASVGAEEVGALLASGGGAARRRAAHARGGIEAMLAELVAETGVER